MMGELLLFLVWFGLQAAVVVPLLRMHELLAWLWAPIVWVFVAGLSSFLFSKLFPEIWGYDAWRHLEESSEEEAAQATTKATLVALVDAQKHMFGGETLTVSEQNKLLSKAGTALAGLGKWLRENGVSNSFPDHLLAGIAASEIANRLTSKQRREMIAAAPLIVRAVEACLTAGLSAREIIEAILPIFS